MGDEEEKGGALIAPALRQHVSAELGRTAAILREKRKSKEALTWAKTQANDSRNGKKNGKNAKNAKEEKPAADA